PREHWRDVNKLFVWHGQTLCLPVKPKCGGCRIQKYCEYGKNVLHS
ncbi:MAG: endonuclease III, partial [Nanoarchaeota archaeon]